MITIHQNASGWNPAYNDNVWVLGSNFAGTKYNFRYVCYVYATDGTTVLATLKAFPSTDPSSINNAYFNVKRILENYLTDTFDLTTTLQCDDSYYAYGIKFAEEYSNTPGGDIIIPASGITAMQSGSVWNAAIPFKDFVAFDDADYYIDTAASSGTWLTNMPVVNANANGQFDIADTERAWLYAIRKPGQTNSVNINYTFNKTGSAPVGKTIAWTTQPYIRVPIGLANCREYFSDALVGITNYGIVVSNNSGFAILTTL